MPIANVQDAHEVERSLKAILSEPDTEDRARAIRTMFVETLDFEHADLLVPLNDAGTNLPSDARLLARLNGFSVLYIPLDGGDNNSVKTAAASAAAKVVGETIADEQLLIFSNRNCDQLHFIYPDLSGAQPRLQRMVVHRGQPARTVVQQIANLWHDYGESGLTVGEAVRNAFSVQPVTDAFFKDYKAAYDEAAKIIADDIVQEDAQQFTQTLFNRLLFVHFVSRKGWLRFNGDNDYLNALWRDYQTDAEGGNFYTSRLTTLFFAGLNNPKSRDLSGGVQPLVGDVPFLNGGLFEETDLDRRAANAVPDGAVAPLITGLFNRYNFTVTESTPLDTEVAVDPEMLGKLFEETVNERNSNGAYYTPRPVVAFMCREAIKGYLSSKNIEGLTDDNIADLVDNAGPQAINVTQALEVANAVAELRAVDPACGSGAFLLGMLQEIVALNETLFRAGHTPESLYRQKLDIISKNIHGVDKDDQAVSTAMLRLWLSLAVDFDGDGTPDPLPNLDLKLVVGDAIAGPNPDSAATQRDWFKEFAERSSLRQDIAAYTTAYGQQKATLKQQVDATKAQLRRQLQGAAPIGAVEWRIEFADVMLNGGFDVVIANPPYVQLQRNSGELANQYRNVGYSTFARTGDIYQLFYERGCQLLNSAHGTLAYITSNSWLKAEYGKATRRYLSEQHTPTLLLEMGKDVFDEAIVDTSVLLLKRGPRDDHDDLSVRAADIDHLEDSVFPPPAEQWGATRPNGDAPWSILSKTEQSIMDKMLAVGTPLKEWDIAIYRGITTGLNEAFIVDNQTKDALVNADPKSAEILKPVVRGRDIRRYQAQWANLWLIDAHNGHGDTPAINVDDFPAVKAHLDVYFPRLAERHDRGRTPYNLRNCAYHADFAHEKLFWMDMSPEGRFAYSGEELYCNDKGFIMTGGSLKYLCAVLNSNLITWLMNRTALTTGMGVLQWKKFAVERLPIPKIIEDQQTPLADLVDRVLSGSAGQQASSSALQAEIDDAVNALYGLNADEVRAIARA